MKLMPAISLALLLPLAPVAQAGPATDELSRCIVQLSSSDDKLTLVRWMFASMALHPAVADLAPVSAEARDAATQEMAALLTTLLEERCLNQARMAIQRKGASALPASFAMLGQFALGELASNSSVTVGLGSLTEYLQSGELDRRLGIGDN